MTVPVVAFFNNKGGVDKTSLGYHLAWMYADMGRRVVAVDLDPQANLTSFFLDEEQIERIWEMSNEPNTIFRSLQPLIRGAGDILSPALIEVEIDAVDLALLAGDLTLSTFAEDLATVWPECAAGRERAFRVMSAFWRIIQKAIAAFEADLVLIDMGSNLGAINRAVMITTDYVVIPLASDLFSVQGLRNLGPALHSWRQQWDGERMPKNPAADLIMPRGDMRPIGYVAVLYAKRQSRITKAYQCRLARMPLVYRTEILKEEAGPTTSIQEDVNRLGTLRHYPNLMSMAQEAHKPIFYLKPADGVMGSHYYAVQDAYQDFRALARQIAERISTLAVESLLFGQEYESTKGTKKHKEKNLKS